MKNKEPRILIDSASPQERRSFLKKLTGVIAGTAALGGFTNLFAKKTYSGTELSTYATPDPYIGSISMVGFNWAPYQWALCWGGLVSISDYTALYSLIGTNFGGDGRVTMGLPDLRGRVPVGYGSGPGLTPKQMGQMWGFENHTLTLAQMPEHSHTADYIPPQYSADQLAYKGRGGLTADPAGNVLGQPTTSGVEIYSSNTANTPMGSSGISITPTSTGSVTVNNAGTGQAFSIMQPWTCVNFIIALEGVYPQRN